MLTPMFAAAADVAVEVTKTAGLSGNFHVAFAALGSAIAVGIIGMKASEAVGRNPGAAGKILTQAIISSALAEGIVFFAIFLVK
ncbi:MAG: ATP synthase F0 subunit C [Verrucomicrobiota bacterium]